MYTGAKGTAVTNFGSALFSPTNFAEPSDSLMTVCLSKFFNTFVMPKIIQHSEYKQAGQISVLLPYVCSLIGRQMQHRISRFNWISSAELVNLGLPLVKQPPLCLHIVAITQSAFANEGPCLSAAPKWKSKILQIILWTPKHDIRR